MINNLKIPYKKLVRKIKLDKKKNNSNNNSNNNI